MPFANVPPPLYLGCITRPVGRPALWFSHGVLVQDDHDPARTGWYPFMHPVLIHTHVTDDVADGFMIGEMLPGILDQAYRVVMNQYLNEAHQSLMGNLVAPAANQTRFVMVDIDDHENGARGSIYLFNGRLIRASDPHLPAAWRQPNALHALGPLDATGQPTQPVRHAIAPGLIRFV